MQLPSPYAGRRGLTMGRPKKIPDSLHEPIRLKHAQEGKGSRAIATWLAEAHGVHVSHQCVNDLLQSLLAERTEVTKAVIAERVGKSVTSDLDVLDEQLQHARSVEAALRAQLVGPDGQALRPSLDPNKEIVGGVYATIGKTPLASVWRQAAAEVRELASKKLALSGAGEPGGKPAGDAPPPGVIVITGKRFDAP